MFGMSVGSMGRGNSDRFTVEAWLSHRLSFGVLIAAVSIYYLFLLSNGTFRLFGPELFGKAFNNMLLHMLRGEFTVDPDVIGYEGFPRDGKTYAYFGVFLALLRLPAMPFTDLARAELARLSCLAAVVIFVALQLRLLLSVHSSLPEQSRTPDLLAVTTIATVLSGPQVYILASAWIYHEPILWSAAMAAAFNLIVTRAAFVRRGLRERDLLWLATLAGFSLLTRPSVGAGLYLGAALLVCWMALHRHSIDLAQPGVLAKGKAFLAMTRELVTDPRLSAPIGILAALAVAVGWVNFERWGSPFTFADFRYQQFADFQANGMEVVHDFGQFNLGRLWIGALYYGTGIPWILKSLPSFAEYLHARYTGIEPPPVAPLLTNPITVLLAAAGLYQLWWKPGISRDCAAILWLTLIGHSFTVLLIFAAMFLALRYRFDLAPFMTLAAAVGYRHASTTMAGMPETRRKRLRIAGAGLCLLGIFCSHYALILHKVWSAGVPLEVRASLLPLSPVSPFLPGGK